MVSDHETNARPGWARVAGVVLLASVLLWWTGLQAWATAQVGYLDVDTLGVPPFMWVLLIALAGTVLLTGVVPRRGASANWAAAVLFVLAATPLAVVNVAYGADDGISAAGWMVAVLSLAQAALFVGSVLWPRRNA
jgi:hypothetical protein